MRQVFSSSRIENAEAVAQMLEEHGIEARVTNGRGWRGAIRGNFSYREQAQPEEQPSVWVIRSDDQPEARRLLREAGLMADTRNLRDSYVPQTMHGTATAKPRNRAGLARKILLIAVALVAAFVWFSQRKPDAPVMQAVAPAPVAAPADLAYVTPPQPYPVAMPTALATLLVNQARDGEAACVSVDGGAPPADWLAQWPDGSVQAATPCAEGLPHIAVADYVTDGMGTGTASVRITGSDGTETEQHWQVERQGLDWRVLGEAPAPSATPQP